MKKIAALLTALVPLFSSAVVEAHPWEGFYVGATGGANFLQNSKKHHGHKNRYDTGYLVGGFVGYRWCEGFRVEGEVSYRSAHLKSIHVRSESGSDVVAVSSSSEDRHGHGNRNNSTWAYMANLYYDIDTCSAFTPYVGGGIGYANVRRSHHHHEVFGSESSSHHSNRRSGFAWQVIAGVGYEVLPCVDLALEYRFFKNNENRVYNQSVGLVAKYHF
jgi:opacity protein-like surface antigen